MKRSIVLSSFFIVPFLWMAACQAEYPTVENSDGEPFFRSEEIFEPIDLHTHGGSVVELPNGDLMAAWFEGTGERWADDVSIRGARYNINEEVWGEPFELANTPGFPDINPVLFLDGKERLWLAWYTVLANQWETSLPKYRISTNYMMDDGPPEWDWQEMLHVKPGDKTERGTQPGDRFVESVKSKTDEYREYLERIGSFVEGDEQVRGSRAWFDERVEEMIFRAEGRHLVRSGRIYDEDGSYTNADLGYPLMRRIGWQTYNKPVILKDGRMILPLYSDGFWNSLMAITDDWGETWSFSEPIIGNSNIQAAIAETADGELVIYMRDNGPPPKRMHTSRSFDRGDTWSPVTYADLPNRDILFSFNAQHLEGPVSETKWGENPASRIFLSRFEAGEKRWTVPEVLERDDPVEIHNSVLWVNDDTLYLFYTTLEGLGHEDSALDLITSADNGQTWSEPRRLREEWGWMFGTNPVNMSNGEVLLPVYKESAPHGVGFKISDDGFETWEVHPSDPESWPRPGIMASVVELEPGELLAYIRYSGQILEIRSSDYGRTWTEPEETNLPNPWSRIALLKLESGNLLMAHNPTVNSPRTPLRLSLSEDGGETWPYWVDVETNLEGRYDYPYLIQASDGYIHLGYSHNNKSTMRHIMFDEDYVRSGQFLFSNERYSTATFENGTFTIHDQTPEI